MQQHKQTGFTVVEASLLIVIIAILGFTGYFVYHSKQTTDKTLTNTGNSEIPQSNQKVTDNGSQKTASVDTLTNVDVSLTYPTTWTVTHPTTSETKITGPAGDIFVDVRGIGGVGGMCDPSDTSQGSVGMATVTPLNNVKFDLAAYTLVASGQSGSHINQVTSEVVPASRVSNYHTGASFCDVYLGSVLDERFLGSPSGDSNPDAVNTIINIQSNNLNGINSRNQQPTSAQVEQFFTSADYKTAVGIVKSFSYK